MRPVIVYGTAYCPYCIAARRFLDQRRVAYEDRRLEGRMDLRIEMENLSGRTSVPQIFIGEHHVGGYDDMVALDRSGELETLLRVAPA